MSAEKVRFVELSKLSSGLTVQLRLSMITALAGDMYGTAVHLVGGEVIQVREVPRTVREAIDRAKQE